VEAEVSSVEGDCCVDVVDDVTDADCGHPRSPSVRISGDRPPLGVELAVLLVDLDEGSVGCPDKERASPFLVDDRSFGPEAGPKQPSLDLLERLRGDEVEREPMAPRVISGALRVVKVELAARCRQLDPGACTRTDIHLETDCLMEALGSRYVGHEMNHPQPHGLRSPSRRSRYMVNAVSTSRDRDMAWSIATCLTRRISGGGR